MILEGRHKKHTWKRCKKTLHGSFMCTSYSEKNGRCDGEAVVYCTKKSHSDRFEPRGGCEARCARHKPRPKKDFKQAICTAPCACTSAEAAMDECACIDNNVGFCRKCGSALHDIWVSTGEPVGVKPKKGAKRR